MPYWENVTRSFRIAWNYKYLWLIALFAGEAGGGGGNYSYSQGTRQTGTTGQNVAALQEQITTWISNHLALILAVAVVWLLVVIAFFILAAVCEGATVRATAEHDADRPFNLSWAWRSGVSTMWVMIRFRLLLWLLYLPILAIGVGLAIAIIAAITGNNAAGPFIGLLALLFLLAIPYAIYLYLLDRLGSRAIVLEQLMARPGIVRGHQLLFKRLGRTLLVWLLSIAVGFVVAILLSCFLAILAIPLFILGAVIYTAGSSAVVPLAIFGGVILFVIALVIQSFFAAQSATYWTLAFRRLDIDYPPPVPYAYPPPPVVR